MTIARAWLLVAFLAAAGAGCSKSESGTPAGGIVSLSVSSGAVVANGANTVTVHASDSGGGTVTVTTDRGSFPGGGKTATVSGQGDVVLTTCDARTDSTCAGVARLRATGRSGTATATVTFGSLAVCATNCGFDPGCATLACTLPGGGSGTCSSTVPSVCAAPACLPNPPGATNESSCSDNVDNDCNDKRDCAETACDGQPCKPGSPTFVCSSGACTDVASGSAITVTAGRTRLPADGRATTPIVVKVTKNGAAQAGVGVSLATTQGGLSATAGATGADGTVAFTFTASASAGTATVTASLAAVPQVSQSAVITLPALGQIQGSVQYPVMGVKGSGYREINPISIALVDDAGQAYPAGLAVRFEHQQLGGSALSTPMTPDTATCSAASGCLGYLTQTDTGGLATANVYSGTVTGTLSVVVSATAGGITRSFAVPSVAVIGARANAESFSIVCNPRNVPALAETNCSTSLVDQQFTCVALLKDRFANLLGTPTQVTFLSEGAAVGQVAVTPAYDPTKPPTAQPDLGKATQIFNTLGAALPRDVAPAPGEPLVGGADACNRSLHPRNGIVTVIAVADGEEAFTDLNGNGVYDGPGSTNLPAAYQASGEPFIDLGEPFVDENDDGRYDLGEPFLDGNQDGTYDGPNGRWDANGKIWTETVVVYTGTPAGPSPEQLATRWVDDVTPFAGACTPTPPAAPFAVRAAVVTPPTPPTSQTYRVVASDRNLNLLASTTAYAVTPTGRVTVSYKGLPAYADDYGFLFRYQVCDRNGASCSDRCQAAPENLPCIMVPSVGPFGCGVASDVVITGGTTAGNPNAVQWKVSLTYHVLGRDKTAILPLDITGTNN